MVPTLNLSCEQEVLPARGVYVTQTALRGKSYRSVTNVGMRPTFPGGRLTVETHLLGFSATVTRGPMEIRFLKRLRGEKKFSGPAALRRQILADIRRARRTR